MAGETVTSRLDTNSSNLEQADILGRTFNGTAVSLFAGNADTVNASATITSASAATMTVDGNSSTLFNFGGEVFKTVTNDEQLRVGTVLRDGPSTPDVLYFFLTDRSIPYLAGPRVSIFTDGNKTATSALPGGSAVFSGVASGVAGSGATARGTIALNTNFATDGFTATLRGVNPTAPTSAYTVANGTLSGGALSGVLTGTSVTDGALTGDIYGARGTQAAGTFVLETSATSLIGVFGAAR
jgi:hypothetical protein